MAACAGVDKTHGPWTLRMPFGSVPANPPQPVSKPHPPQFHVATVAVLLLQSTIVAVTAVNVLLFFVL